MTTRIVKDDVPLLLQAIEDLTRQQVLVGIPGDSEARKDSKDPSNALIGCWMEFGVPSANIPARPFLVPGVNEALPEIVKRLETGARKALTFPIDPNAGMVTLNEVGLIAQRTVRSYINQGVPPPLAASTLRARRAAGRTGTKPLISTGQLRNSVTYVIRNR